MKLTTATLATALVLLLTTPALAQNGLVQEITPSPVATPSPTPAAVRAATLAPAPSPTTDPAAEREAYTVANALYAGGKFSEAVPLLRAFLRRFPNSPDTVEIHYKLGDALRRIGEASEAEDIFNSIYKDKKNSPYSAFAAMRLAEMRMAGGDMAGALSLLDHAIATAPTTGLRLNAIYAKILALQNLNRISETPELLDQLTSVRENNPYLPFAELALGRYHESISDFETALRHYSRALAQSSSADIRAEAGTRAAVMAMRQAQHSEAIRLFDTTLRLDPPENWRRLCQLGLLRAQAAAGEHAGFLRSWDAFNLEIAPELQPEFLYHRANALRSTTPSNTASARTLYSQILENHPESPFAEHAAYELLLMRQAENEPAEKLIPALRNFLGKHPQSTHAPMIRYLLARALAADGRQNEALPLLMENIKIGQPQQALPEMRLQAALALMADQKPSEALAQLLTVLEQNPEPLIAESALQLTALAQEAAGQTDDALATWDTLITRFPNTIHRPMALFRSGLIHARANRWPETRRAMRSLLLSAPDFPGSREARFWRGLAAYHEGDTREASSELRQVVDSALENDVFLLPALQHLILIAAKEQDLESADPLARSYLQASQSNTEAPPLSPELMLWLASSREKLGQHSDAQYWYEKLVPAAEDKDTKTLALIGLAKSRLALGHADAALEAVHLLLQHDTDLEEAPEILLLHAQALLAAGQPRNALPKAEKVLSQTREPQFSARSRLLLGDIHTALDDHQEALKFYSSASLLYDDPDITPEALRKSAATARRLGLASEAAKFERDLSQRYRK